MSPSLRRASGSATLTGPPSWAILAGASIPGQRVKYCCGHKGFSDMTTIDIRRADERFTTKIDWLDSKHSFSFGPHYDPTNTHHGLLLVNNDDIVPCRHRIRHPRPPRHGDRDVGAVRRARTPATPRATTGSSPRHGPAHVGRIGIRHSEHNPSPDTDVHFLQMWVPPDTAGHRTRVRADRRQRRARLRSTVPDRVGQGPRRRGHLHQADAVLWGGRLAAGAARRRPRPTGTSTSSSHAARARSTRRRPGDRRRRSGHRHRRALRSRPARTVPRCRSGSPPDRVTA